MVSKVNSLMLHQQLQQKPRRSFAQFDVFTYDSWSHLTGPDSRDSRRSAEHWGCSGLTCTGNVPDDTCAALEGKSRVGVSVHCAFSMELGVNQRRRAHRRHLPQSRSSELSPQSLSLSHTQAPEMHCPLSQRYSLSEQGLGSARHHQGHTHTHTLSSVLKTFSVFLIPGSSE